MFLHLLAQQSMQHSVCGMGVTSAAACLSELGRRQEAHAACLGPDWTCTLSIMPHAAVQMASLNGGVAGRAGAAAARGGGGAARADAGAARR